MAKLIYHIDDTLTALKVAANLLKAQWPDAELKQFQKPKDLFLALDAEIDIPWMFLCDVNMPLISGFDVLSIIKRHPRYHYAPVVMLTAETNPTDRDNAIKLGALEYLNKPLTVESLEIATKKREGLALDYVGMAAIDQNFSEEAADLLADAYKLLDSINENAINALYRTFHTVKGGANSLSFPAIGAFMHNAEAFLTAVKTGSLYQMPQTKNLLLAVLGYVEEQVNRIKTKTLLEKPPQALIDDLTLFKNNVAAGWMQNQTPAPTTSALSAVAKEGPALGAGIVSRSSSSVRVTNERLDELQQKFKSIMTTKVKLSSFANQLKAEFHDEGFPNDLLKMVESLNSNAMAIMEFFISLRVVPATRLKAYSDRIIAQTVDALGKPARLVFHAESNLEVDLPIIECLENSLMHLLRNGIDHGLEKVEERTAVGKAPEGLLQLTVQRDGDENIKLILQDDGKGINQEALKAAVAKKNIVASDVLAHLKPNEINELIFLDGLSTRTEVSDVSGRGVGLGAVKEMILEMGGSITVDTELGKGTKFCIILPRIFRL